MVAACVLGAPHRPKDRRGLWCSTQCMWGDHHISAQEQSGWTSIHTEHELAVGRFQKIQAAQLQGYPEHILVHEHKPSSMQGHGPQMLNWDEVRSHRVPFFGGPLPRKSGGSGTDPPPPRGQLGIWVWVPAQSGDFFFLRNAFRLPNFLGCLPSGGGGPAPSPSGTPGV